MNSNKDQNNEDNLNEEIKNVKESIENEEIYKFGWSKYSELTNGRFAMLGFLAIFLIEFLSKKTFLHWSGIS